MTAKRKQSRAETTKIARVGKDEMNLAEFPTAILTTRSNDGIKTLRFQDSHGQLTVTGSDAFGLPTPIDTDVLVALIEMTKKKNNFTEGKVNFTRYELIRLIGWANVGTSYDRLKESLDRWAGVLLVYDGCWWDNRLKRHVSRTVHIIEDVMVVDGKIKAERDGRQQILPLSSFKWSDHFMESFQANNLKSLDTDFYFSLEFPTSKQLFRFLDKRFSGGRPEWSFDLEQLAFEHVGLSRNYSPPKIKEKLGKSIEELENKGFLKSMPREQRYVKVDGRWKIRLIDGRALIVNKEASEPAEGESSPAPLPALVTDLISRGVGEKAAAELKETYAAEVIATKIEEFDWLMGTADKPKRPAGYLVKSIQDGYGTPKGFVSKEEEARLAKIKAETSRKAAEERRRKQKEEDRERAERKAIEAHWESLPKVEQAQLDADAQAEADPESLKLLESGPLRKYGIKSIRDRYIVKLLRSQGKLPVVDSPDCPANGPQDVEPPFRLGN